jgi:hypothetical protein
MTEKTTDIIIHNITVEENKDVFNQDNVKLASSKESIQREVNRTNQSSDIAKAIVFSSTIFVGTLMYLGVIYCKVDWYFPFFIFLVVCYFAYNFFFLED